MRSSLRSDIIRLIFRRKLCMLCRKNKAGTRIPHFTRDNHYTPTRRICKYPICTIFCRKFWQKVYDEKFKPVCRSCFCAFCQPPCVVVPISSFDLSRRSSRAFHRGGSLSLRLDNSHININLSPKKRFSNFFIKVLTKVFFCGIIL